MAVFTHRVQTVLTKEQYAVLQRLSAESGTPLGLLIRQAIEKVYFEPAQRERRQAALESLLSLNAPVSDWEQMEDEISRGYLE